MQETIKLTYDINKWVEQPTKPLNTLQIFVTNRCDMRCKGCFFAHSLGKEQIAVDDYRDIIAEYSSVAQKVILLGGEPTLHSQLEKFIEINKQYKLKTTIYTNGHFLDRLNNLSISDDVELRIGVYGNKKSEKPLSGVKDCKLPVKIVYMLRRDNIDELTDTVKTANDRFDCKSFYLSSIRDITETGDFWKDTDDTISPQEFAKIVQQFVDSYNGNIKRLDIATRGVLVTDNQTFDQVKHCRFGNVFQNGNKIICPFDIGRNITSPKLLFGQRCCNKSSRGCILQKIVLTRR